MSILIPLFLKEDREDSNTWTQYMFSQSTKGFIHKEYLINLI